MRKIILVFSLCASFKFFSQAPKRFYTKFGGEGIDIGYSAKPTKDKQYIVVGSTSSYGNGSTDVYLVKLDSMGVPIWEKYFGGFNNDVGRSVLQLPDSGYVVTGFTSSFGAGGYDAYVLRTDKNGNLIWQKALGGLDWDFAYDAVLAPDGDIVICGNTSSSGAGKKDGFLAKLDVLGNSVWQKTIGGIENEELKSVITTNDNFLATVGYTQSNGDINGDAYFYKFDLSGNIIFDHVYGDVGKDYANDITQKANGDYLICGAKTYTTHTKTESLVYTISSTGAFLWENHYYDSPGADEEFFSSCEVINNPNFTAYIRNRPKTSFKMQVSIYVGPQFYWFGGMINENGGSEDEFGYSVESTPDGGYITVGVTNSFGGLNGDVYFLKQDTDLVNNTSVVGLLTNSIKEKKPTLRYQNNNEIILTAEDAAIVNYRLMDLSGSMLTNEAVNLNELKLDLSKYPKSMLILEITLKTGAISRYKLINL